MSQLVIRALVVTLLCCAVACGGKSRKADEEPTEQKSARKEEPVDLDEIPPEELANSPCGNPDWSRLPPQSPQKEDDESQPRDSE
jgi:hypothetical protein